MAKESTQGVAGDRIMEKIGFIGLGMMGHGMAKNIAEKGYPLTILARRKSDAVEDMIGRGAVAVSTAKDVSARSTVVFICVTGSSQVETLMRGEDGVLSNMERGGVVVDCSTSDPNSTLLLAREAAACGIEFVDAPLSRTPKEAWEGTLDTMVGTSPAVFERIKPVLDTWAGRIVHIGNVGDGHKIKLLNNFLGMGYAALFSEALVLAAKSGISPERFDQVIRGGRMESPFYQTFMKYVLERDRDAHKFSIANAFKDMKYLESLADHVEVVNPMGNAIKNYFGMAVASGAAEDYVPMLSDYVARLNGVDLAKKA
jgi:3-hydroxyisobutyrate dehydrogenase-like beta-hydroxyacid dehydrogenase